MVHILPVTTFPCLIESVWFTLSTSLHLWDR